jgi:hypothetical protein
MAGQNHISIVKASGQVTYFVPSKLKKSLIRSGASADQAESILSEIEAGLYTGITTRKIYQKAFKLLRKYSKPVAARYKLKQAIMELGPEGYAFENFIGELLKHQGYAVQVGIIVNGKCVKHEVDVAAEKDDRHFMIECKFHNQPGLACDVKVPLYIQSRFKDVEEQWKNLPGHSKKFHKGWVVTNTRFTTDAIQYGTCAGLDLIGWNYPARDSLNELIDRLGLYPLTCLSFLNRQEKQQLLGQKIILCKELCQNEKYLSGLKIEPARIKNILEEASSLCQKIIVSGKH